MIVYVVTRRDPGERFTIYENMFSDKAKAVRNLEEQGLIKGQDPDTWINEDDPGWISEYTITEQRVQ